MYENIHPSHWSHAVFIRRVSLVIIGSAILALNAVAQVGQESGLFFFFFPFFFFFYHNSYCPALSKRPVVPGVLLVILVAFTSLSILVAQLNPY